MQPSTGVLSPTRPMVAPRLILLLLVQWLPQVVQVVVELFSKQPCWTHSVYRWTRAGHHRCCGGDRAAASLAARVAANESQREATTGVGAISRSMQDNTTPMVAAELKKPAALPMFRWNYLILASVRSCRLLPTTRYQSRHEPLHTCLQLMLTSATTCCVMQVLLGSVAWLETIPASIPASLLTRSRTLVGQFQEPGYCIVLR